MSYVWELILFFNTIPTVGDFIYLFIVVVGGGVSWSINLLVFVVIVLGRSIYIVWLEELENGWLFLVRSWWS